MPWKVEGRETSMKIGLVHKHGEKCGRNESTKSEMEITILISQGSWGYHRREYYGLLLLLPLLLPAVVPSTVHEVPRHRFKLADLCRRNHSRALVATLMHANWRKLAYRPGIHKRNFWMFCKRRAKLLLQRSDSSVL